MLKLSKIVSKSIKYNTYVTKQLVPCQWLWSAKEQGILCIIVCFAVHVRGMHWCRAYAWSYGPLAWLYPSEIQPLETRSAGLAVASFRHLLLSFVIAQTFLTMLRPLPVPPRPISPPPPSSPPPPPRPIPFCRPSQLSIVCIPRARCCASPCF